MVFQSLFDPVATGGSAYVIGSKSGKNQPE